MIRWFARRRVWREAATWYARMAEPQSSDEVAAFERWLARDPAHGRAYAEMEGVMRAVGEGAARPHQPAGRSWSLRPALAFALAAAVLATVVIVSQGRPAPAFAAVVNEGSAVRGVRLGEGTVVWLDVGARIGVRLGERRREIDVREGRVRIEPSRDPRPFVVTAHAALIMPDGARLDVAIEGDRVEVGALEGPLTLIASSRTGDGSPVRVAGGSGVVVDGAATRSGSIDRAWPAARLPFDAVPLARIAALANTQDGPDIVVGPDIAALRVTGVFDLRDTRRLARKLAATLDLRVEETSAGLVLRR